MFQVLLTLTALLSAQVDEPKVNKLPEDILKLLLAADRIEIISVDCDEDASEGKTGYYKRKVLGSAMVQVTDDTKKIIGAISDAIASQTPDDKFRCFEPRHGIRATSDGKTVDLVICFACHIVAVYLDNKAVGSFAISDVPRASLNKILKEAKVPLAKGAEGKEKQ